MLTIIETVEDFKPGVVKVGFNYRGLPRHTLVTDKAYAYLKKRTPKLTNLVRGMKIDVIKSIKPSRNQPDKLVELYKIAEVKL